MLGKKDFINELGKGICIYPFHEKNIKENSYNLTIGQNAWSLGSSSIIRREEGKYTKPKSGDRKEQFKSINKGQSAIVEDGSNRYLILNPHTTTIVETSEAVGVDNRIGGTIHSKVGIVALGIGDTSTMLGPCFCGHLMISLHNVTDEVVTLPVGDTFVSLIFYYLNTPNDITKNTNMSGHVDKLSELGIQISKKTREFLLEDWKQNIDGIRDRLTRSDDYIKFQNKVKEKKNENIKRIFSLRNIILVIILAVIFLGLFLLSIRMDRISGNSKWMDRFWTIVLTVLIIPLLNFVKNRFDK